MQGYGSSMQPDQGPFAPGHGPTRHVVAVPGHAEASEASASPAGELIEHWYGGRLSDGPWNSSGR